MKPWTYLAIPLMLLPGTTLAATQELYRDADAYAVYSVVLPHEDEGQRLVLRETTGIDPELWPLERCYSLKDDENKKLKPLFDNFEQVNKKSWILLPMLTIGKPYDLVPKSKVYVPDVSGDADKAWEAQHPGAWGYLWVSAVGFNAEHTRALVSVSHICGNMCAGGHYYELEKKDGKWQLSGKTGVSCMWVS